jgi:broad specificity phosphatase PhoE
VGDGHVRDGRVGDGVRIWCLRHAQSRNVTGALAGAVPHAPLTALGHRQAAATARVLTREPITAVHASDALRARQTAAPLAAALGVPVLTLAELAEAGVGRHEASTDPAVARLTAEALHAWVTGDDLERRVADGESGREVVARVTAAFERIAGEHPGGTVAVVGHVASLTAALSGLCGLGARVWGTPLPHAEPFLVTWDGRTWHCAAWPGAVAAR